MSLKDWQKLNAWSPTVLTLLKLFMVLREEASLNNLSGIAVIPSGKVIVSKLVID